MVSNTESIDGPTATPVKSVLAPFMMTPSFVPFSSANALTTVSMFSSEYGLTSNSASKRSARSGSHVLRSGNFDRFFSIAAGSKS